MFVSQIIHIFGVLVLFFTIIHTRKLPPYLTLCHQNDPNLNACILRAIEQLRPHMRAGIPEMLIPSMDPLRVPEASLDTGGFHAGFKNIEIFYADEFIVHKLHVDLKRDRIEMAIALPRLRLKSTYNVDGRILVLQLKGEGPADGNFTNVAGTITAEGERYMKKGKEYIKFKSSELHLNFGKPVFQFDNLFRENRELNDQTNKILNENIVDVMEEIRPVIDKTVHEIIHGIISRIFDRFSFEELFPK